MPRSVQANQAYFLVVCVVLSIFCLYACKKEEAETLVLGSWIRKADLPATGRIMAAGLSIGKKGYVGTGAAKTPNDIYLSDWFEYDPATDLWTRKADYPGAGISNAVHLVINGKAYVGIGQTYSLPSFTTAFYAYDPVTNSWSRKSDFPGKIRKGATGFGTGNKGYVGLGSYDEIYKDWWEYDPAIDKWTQKADYPGISGDFCSGFVIKNMVYVGKPSSVAKGGEWWQYDPLNDKWSAKSPCPGPLNFGFKGFSIGDNGYLAGGFFNPEIWEYNTVADNWYRHPFQDARLMGFSFSIDGKGYHGTGVKKNDEHKNDLWEFTPGK